MKYLKLVLIITLIIISAYLLFSDYELKNKCKSFVIYNPENNSWRWKYEFLEEYYPNKKDAIDNCITTFKRLDI